MRGSLCQVETILEADTSPGTSWNGFSFWDPV